MFRAENRERRAPLRWRIPASLLLVIAGACSESDSEVFADKAPYTHSGELYSLKGSTSSCVDPREDPNVRCVMSGYATHSVVCSDKEGNQIIVTVGPSNGHLTGRNTAPGGAQISDNRDGDVVRDISPRLLEGTTDKSTAWLSEAETDGASDLVTVTRGDSKGGYSPRHGVEDVSPGSLAVVIASALVNDPNIVSCTGPNTAHRQHSSSRTSGIANQI